MKQLAYTIYITHYVPRFQYMSYRKLNGTHQPKSAKHFFPIMKALQKIHDRSMVHEDIRMANLVFGENEDASWIIYFDMASKVGTTYCEEYKSKETIGARHNDASESKQMCSSHDRYSLAVLMKDCNTSNE